MQKKYIYVLLCIVILLCCKQEGPIEVIPSKHNYVRLEKQSEHSGIMVSITDFKEFVLTDSLGYFKFDSIPDGNYTLKAKYPYFLPKQITVEFKNNRITTQVKIELKQQMQFWIEPPETTVSISGSTFNNPEVFKFGGLRMYGVNTTDQPVTLGTWVEPRFPWALEPQSFDWPLVPPDNIEDYCYSGYGSLGGGAFIIDFKFRLQPGDTLWDYTPRAQNWLEKICVKPGKYLLFGAISDLGHYPEYFEIGYFWPDTITVPPYPPINPLLKTITKKKALFRPATINIIN